MNGGDFCVLGFELHNERSTRNHSRNVANVYGVCEWTVA